MRQHYSKSTELWNKKVKGKPELLKIGLRSRNDRGLALDLLKKNRAPLSENIRKWGSVGVGWALTNLVGERGYHGTDKKPEGLGSKGEISILIWSLIFSSRFVYLFLHRGRYTLPEEKKGISTVGTWETIKGSVALVYWQKKKWERWVVLSLTMPQSELFICVCQCPRGLVEEEQPSCPWNRDIRCCVHVLRKDVPTSAS